MGQSLHQPYHGWSFGILASGVQKEQSKFTYPIEILFGSRGVTDNTALSESTNWGSIPYENAEQPHRWPEAGPVHSDSNPDIAIHFGLNN